MKHKGRLSAVITASALLLSVLHGMAFAEDTVPPDAAEAPAAATESASVQPVAEEASEDASEESPEILLLGDITGDGAVDMKDAMRILVVYSEGLLGTESGGTTLPELTEREYLCGNVDGTVLTTESGRNQDLNPIDVLLIMAHTEMELLEEPATWVDIFALKGKEEAIEQDRGDYVLTYLPEYGDYVLVKKT